MTSTKLKHPIIAGGVERRGGMADSSLSLGIVIGAAMAGSFKSVMGNSVAQVDRLDAAIKKQWLGKALTGDIVKLQNPIQSPLAEQEQAGGSSDKLAQKIRDFERKLAETNQKLSRHFIAIGGVVGEHGKFVGVALQKSAQPGGPGHPEAVHSDPAVGRGDRRDRGGGRAGRRQDGHGHRHGGGRGGLGHDRPAHALQAEPAKGKRA